MPRLSKVLVAEREDFAKQCFSESKSVDQTQQALAAKYNGVKMNPYRLTEIFQSNDWAGGAREPFPSSAELPPEVQEEQPERAKPAPKTTKSWSNYSERAQQVIVSQDGFMTIREILTAMKNGTYPL
jgi:hypothetical protein